MHRLSTRQEAMLKELHDVAKRIEQLSKVEHDLLREVHPTVEKIKESVDDVATAVGSGDPSQKS
jgi:predicted transcriptional regulator